MKDPVEQVGAFQYPSIFAFFPLSTFCMMGILVAIRYEDVLVQLDDYSYQYNVSKVVLGLIIIAAISGTVVLTWGGYTLYQYQIFLARQREEIENIFETERQSLVVFFNALDGNGWKDKTRWCSDEPISRWKGVHVDGSGRVKKIILDENLLKGHIPAEIGNFRNLRELDLRLNKIDGPLPDAILDLGRMEGLYLYNNFITGEIPAERMIRAYPNLMGIYLYNNSFDNPTAARSIFNTHFQHRVGSTVVQVFV